MCSIHSYISKEDCVTIIRKWLNKKNVQLIQYSAAPLSGEVKGFLGEHYILKISAQDNGKISEHRFFAKTAPTALALQVEFLKVFSGFERESSFFEKYVKEFQQVLPGFKPSFAPKFLLAKNDKVVVFEDLSVKEYGASRTSHPDDMDIEHLKVVLEALAKLHSGSLAYEEMKTKESGKVERIFPDNPGIFREEHFRTDKSSAVYRWVQSGVNALGDLSRELPETKLTKENLNEFFATCCKKVSYAPKFRKVLGHNDLWDKNILFKYKNNIPVKAKLVDYQLAAYYPAVLDVVFFICINANNEVKKNEFENLLKYYYSCLTEELKRYDFNVEEIFPFDEIKESTEYFLPAILLKVAFYKSMLCVNDEYLSAVVKDPTKFDEFMLGDRGVLLVKLFKSDSYYKGTMTRALVDVENVMFGSQCNL